MHRVGRFFLWFLLVPYFWAKSWNSRPLLGGADQEFTNRINGLIVIGLIFACGLFGIMSATGNGHLLWGKGYLRWGEVFGVTVYLLGIVGAALLVNSEREKHYWALYQVMPIRNRWAFGIVTLALILWGALIGGPATNHSSAEKSISCPVAVEEITALCS